MYTGHMDTTSRTAFQLIGDIADLLAVDPALMISRPGFGGSDLVIPTDLVERLLEMAASK